MDISSHFPLIFMGTPVFSEKILSFLLNTGWPIKAVYTQPPKPRGRGHDIFPSPVHETALKHHLPVFTPLSLKSPDIQTDFLKCIHTHNIQAVLVIAYGLILPKIILEAPPFGCLNLHVSLLPRWRGAAPIQRAIEAGDTVTGLTLMHMTEGLDEGQILSEKKILIAPKETSQSLFTKLEEMSGPFVFKALQDFLTHKLTPRAQSLEGVTYASKISKEEGFLDFSQSAFILERKVRAFAPWPGAFFKFNGLPLKVLEAEAETSHLKGESHTIIDIHPLKILCADGTLFLPQKIQKPGGSVLNVNDFLRGFSIPLGSKVESYS